MEKTLDSRAEDRENSLISPHMYRIEIKSQTERHLSINLWADPDPAYSNDSFGRPK